MQLSTFSHRSIENRLEPPFFSKEAGYQNQQINIIQMILRVALFPVLQKGGRRNHNDLIFMIKWQLSTSLEVRQSRKDLSKFKLRENQTKNVTSTCLKGMWPWTAAWWGLQTDWSSRSHSHSWCKAQWQSWGSSTAGPVPPEPSPSSHRAS